MKNLVIGLFVLGLTSLGFSQNTNREVEEVKLKDVVLTNINLGYLEQVQDKNMSNHVKLLENEASSFDISESPKFDGRAESFKTVFRGSKGYIIATYDNNGKILKTSERFKDIKLPKNIIKSVLNQYPDSDFLKVVYTVAYDDQKGVEKTYRVQIMNNDEKKNLKISSNGNANDAISMILVR